MNEQELREVSGEVRDRFEAYKKASGDLSEGDVYLGIREFQTTYALSNIGEEIRFGNYGIGLEQYIPEMFPFDFQLNPPHAGTYFLAEVSQKEDDPDKYLVTLLESLGEVGHVRASHVTNDYDLVVRSGFNWERQGDENE